MARDATARLYDVDEDRVVFKRLHERDKYDQGEIHFQARPGCAIDLDKLHESVWATRLSGGTRSGLVRLEVTALGRIRQTDGGWTLETGKETFRIKPDPQAGDRVLEHLQQLERRDSSAVTGYLEGWQGRWPDVLAALPPKPRTLIVTSLDSTAEPQAGEETQ